MTVTSQVESVSQMKEELNLQTQLVEQYEQRFIQLRDIIEKRDRETKSKINEQDQAIQDLTFKLQKQQNLAQQLEQERSNMSTQLKDATWSKDQEGKKYQREINRLKELNIEEQQDYQIQISNLKNEITQKLNQEIYDKNQDIIRIESSYIERLNELGNEINMLMDQLKSKEMVIQEQRTKINEQARKIDDFMIQSVKLKNDGQSQAMDLEIQLSRLRTDKEHGDQQKMEMIQDLQKQLQEVTLNKDRVEQEMKLVIDKLLYDQQVTQQKHDMEIQKFQTQTGHNLQHLQDMLLIQQTENDRLRQENDLMQKTLHDQDEMSRREMEEMQTYSKNVTNNYEKQLKEFKMQLQYKNKEILNLREEAHECQKLIENKNKEIERIKYQAQNDEYLYDQ
ncbi:UNKNOWN [Stylonychia lemnae]|uniref:Uncharacterized protein n=1 Tax=Stylonychia lemnae TaxID=5949 RepID=A0A078B2I9_STYLE|nr:UNKNOWN [Stylonychia lemnae]|eukprot:CDW87698.1 UNKNOWN [Stylonychia lemnae]